MGVVMNGEWKGFWFRVQSLGSRVYDFRAAYLLVEAKAEGFSFNH
jgi:hypothetical protein